MQDKEMGVIRKIDELGRIVVPKEIREKLEINNCDEVEISVKGKSIIIKKYFEVCNFCGKKGQIMFKNKLICKSCLNELSKITEGS